MANAIKKFRFTVKEVDNGKRLDAWLAQKISGYSRSFIVSQIKLGYVQIDKTPTKSNNILRTGQSVTVELHIPTTEIEAEQIDVQVIYQDKDMAVINKPAGLVMHPAGAYKKGTLANALKYHFPGFYLVHRLDKDTSGVVLVALNQTTKDYLSKLFQDRKIKKTYLALLVGKITPEEACLDLPIKRNEGGKFDTLSGGRVAKSFYRVKNYYPGYSLVEVQPETGRTHQIRVHFQAIKHPVVGDTMYGKAEPGLNRHFLHAYKIEFMDRHGHKQSFTAPLPPELDNFLKNIKQ